MKVGFSCNIYIYNFHWWVFLQYCFWRVPLILDIVEKGEEDGEEGYDDEGDDSQATVYYSTEFHTLISLFEDLFLRVLD